MFATIGDTRIFFDIEGAGLVAKENQMVEKPVIISIHGSFINHACFKPYLSPLAEHYQIIYVDCRGWGYSDFSDESRWNFSQFADDILSLMDYIGIERAFILGHSMGAHTATMVALREPDKVLGCILVNPAFWQPDDFYTNVKFKIGLAVEKIARRLFEERDETVVEEFVCSIMPHQFQTNTPLDMVERGQTSITLFFYTFDEFLAIRLKDLLPQIKVRSLICNGDHDLYNPADLDEQLKESVENPVITVKQYHKSGHFILNDEPDKLLRDVRKFIEAN